MRWCTRATKETFGLVILEAMACGRPVVAVRAAAIPEFVDDGVGLLAEPGSGARMAEAIAELYERDIEALGANARAKVLRKYTWNRAFQGQMATYRALLGRERAVVPATELAEPS